MSGDNVQTIDVSEVPLPRLTQIKQEIDTQVEMLGSSLQQLKIAQKKYSDSKDAVERMQEMKAGNPMLVPLTDSMYVPGQLDETENVIIDIGTGYYVEKNLKDAINYFKRKVTFVTAQIEKVQNILKNKLIGREMVIEAMENKIQATLAAQHATEASK